MIKLVNPGNEPISLQSVLDSIGRICLVEDKKRRLATREEAARGLVKYSRALLRKGYTPCLQGGSDSYRAVGLELAATRFNGTQGNDISSYLDDSMSRPLLEMARNQAGLFYAHFCLSYLAQEAKKVAQEQKISLKRNAPAQDEFEQKLLYVHACASDVAAQIEANASEANAARADSMMANKALLQCLRYAADINIHLGGPEA